MICTTSRHNRLTNLKHRIVEINTAIIIACISTFPAFFKQVRLTSLELFSTLRLHLNSWRSTVSLFMPSSSQNRTAIKDGKTDDSWHGDLTKLSDDAPHVSRDELRGYEILPGVGYFVHHIRYHHYCMIDDTRILFSMHYWHPSSDRLRSDAQIRKSFETSPDTLLTLNIAGIFKNLEFHSNNPRKFPLKIYKNSSNDARSEAIKHPRALSPEITKRKEENRKKTPSWIYFLFSAFPELTPFLFFFFIFFFFF